MQSSAISYNQYPALKDKDEAFKALVNSFITELQTLSVEQKRKLGLFKAIELTNAVVQNLEKDQASESLGAAKALALFNLVRAAIRNRVINLPDNTTISLKDDRLKILIDRACVMFHAGKSDPEQKVKAVAFSMAQNIILDSEIKQGIEKFCNYYPELQTPEVINIVKDKYLNCVPQNV